MRTVAVGEAVVYVDPMGKARPALVTAVWPNEYAGAYEQPDGTKFGGTAEPGLNVIFISDDDKRQDPYGRQTERATSVVHRTGQPAHGNYWKRADE